MTNSFSAFESRMQQEQLPQIVINTFHHYYEQLVNGETGLIPEDSIKPVQSLPDADQFGEDLFDLGKEALPKTVMIKLNGGLGTGMGLNKAKSLLKVRDELTFLDIIARQAETDLVPLVLMNSFATQTDSLQLLSKYPTLKKGKIPLDFLQHKAPKVLKSDFSPAVYPKDPELEWYPPGHGDLYTALITSRMLEKLLSAGYEYAFVSNADNLGACLDKAILGYFAGKNFPFMMECADRTEADKKGGHLAAQPAGGLLLRESAQCPENDLDAFQDILKHRYFNTNNLWINLKALAQVMAEKSNILGLSLIRNLKTLDPRDSKSPEVYQLETAMGSAIAVFRGAAAVRVPRTRFAPVKTNSDLLAVRSDAYILTDDFRVVQNPKRKLGTVVISLDNRFFKLIDQLEERFPQGAPSLLECERLDIKGDVRFGANIQIKGSVALTAETNPKIIPDNTILEGR